MVYDLLIRLSRLDSDVYSELLYTQEFVSGIANTIKFEITNLGVDFPGGEINEIKTFTPIQLRDLFVQEGVNIVIPEIPSGESYHFEHEFHTLPIPGALRIMFNIIPKIEDTVNYYRTESSPAIDDEMFNNVYVIKERLLLDILVLLRDFSAREGRMNSDE
ncbi:hypothetical protein ES703_41035 [subsurface metagenome]